MSAAVGIFMLAAGSSAASAQTAGTYDVKSAVQALEIDRSAKPFGQASWTAAVTKPVASAATFAKTAATTTASAIATVTGTIVQAQPARSVTVNLPPNIGQEAAWLHRNGWPLYALVGRYSTGAPLDQQANCIATAVYHEARGETLEGQLAVARVIMNRAASGKYPTSWCGVVMQPWQFSFVNPRTGHYPSVDYSSRSWANALGITRLAISNAVPTLSNDVLWYHADYVAPSWGRRLNRVQQIGAHIFYRA